MYIKFVLFFLEKSESATDSIEPHQGGGCQGTRSPLSRIVRGKKNLQTQLQPEHRLLDSNALAARDTRFHKRFSLTLLCVPAPKTLGSFDGISSAPNLCRF